MIATSSPHAVNKHCFDNGPTGRETTTGTADTIESSTKITPAVLSLCIIL